jgi:hypothetical protein
MKEIQVVVPFLLILLLLLAKKEDADASAGLWNLFWFSCNHQNGSMVVRNLKDSILLL